MGGDDSQKLLPWRGILLPSGAQQLNTLHQGLCRAVFSTMMRPINGSERELVRTMLLRKGPQAEELDQKLACALVEDMQDGGMGSIRFLATGNNQPASCEALAEAEYTDDDGVLVSIVVNGDDTGALSELDFWKVDFSPLRRYPLPSDLRVRQ